MTVKHSIADKKVTFISWPETFLSIWAQHFVGSSDIHQHTAAERNQHD